MAGDAPRRPHPPGRRPRTDTSPAHRDGPPPGPGPVLERAFDRSSLEALRAAVAAHAFLAGVPRAQVEDLVLVAHELAANAVLHGAGHGRLRAWRHGQAMHCEVTDDGPPAGAVQSQAAAGLTTPRGAGGPGAPPAAGSVPPDRTWWPAEHGHGLWVVSQLTDQASLRSGSSGTTAAARLPLAQPRP